MLLRRFDVHRLVRDIVVDRTMLADGGVRVELDPARAPRREALGEDLQQRTGLKIQRVEIGDVNFLRDTAVLRVYCHG